MNNSLRTIAVDLTPILPGGENGGAKIFVLELLRQLAGMEPQTRFILLTQAASHEELATLDEPNVRRVMVVGPVVSSPLRQRMNALHARILSRLPGRLRNMVNQLIYRLSIARKRSSSGSLLRDMHVDLLFCPFTAPTYAVHNIPTVCTIYDLQYKTYPEFFTAADVAQRHLTFIDACRSGTALAAISDYSRNSAITHGKLNPDRIRTIHLRMAQRMTPGANPDLTALDRLGLSRQSYLIYPANFWKHKNHEMLLTAFGMACHGKLPAETKLVCTGAPGARQDWLKRAAHAMGLGERVIFPGYLPNAELSALISSCAGVVFPSLYEGFGLPVIEAMAAGVPVACSNTTSLPEVASDAAILFDPRIPAQVANAMVTLVGDQALRAQLVQAGLRRASEFSDVKRMAREYWELFQYALSNPKNADMLTGNFRDGWVGHRFTVGAGPANGDQTIEIELVAPPFLPHPSVTVTTSLGDSYKINRASSLVLSLPFPSQGGSCEMDLSPAFVPADIGLGVDKREITARLKRCEIVRGNGVRVVLFPEEVPA